MELLLSVLAADATSFAAFIQAESDGLDAQGAPEAPEATDFPDHCSWCRLQREDRCSTYPGVAARHARGMSDEVAGIARYLSLNPAS